MGWAAAVATWMTAWVSSSTAPKKFLRFLISQELFLFTATGTHSGSFYCTIWLDAGTFDNKISYRPANKLTDTSPRSACYSWPYLLSFYKNFIVT